MDKVLEKNLASLETLLHEQLKLHEQMLALLQRKKAALARADHAQVTDLCKLENQQVQAVGELEKNRLRLVGDLTLQLEPAAAAPMTLPELAQRLPEPARGRLLVLRQQVRQRMEQVRQEASVIRRATESLMHHIQGLVQTIGSAMHGVGTYNRAGAPPKAALAVSTFSTTG